MSGALAWNDDHLMTVEEFRAWSGDGTGQLFDLVNGRVRAQGAPSQTHGTTQSNMISLLIRHFEDIGRDCRALPTPAIVPEVLSNWNERYPDVGITCELNDPKVHEMRNPLVIVEILSPTNANDTWDNFPIYTSLASVREILYLESEAIYGYFFRRLPDGSWPKSSADIRADGTVSFDEIGWSAPMSRIYRGTMIDAAAPPRRGLPKQR
jgi:Uma2 family endonuclease